MQIFLLLKATIFGAMNIINRSLGGKTMAFIEGEYYSREQIHTAVGASISAFPPALVRAGELIVAVCLTRKMNPEAPEIYLNGIGPKMLDNFEKLHTQRTPFPVFVKEPSKSKSQFRGYFLVKEFKTDSETKNKHKKSSGRSDIHAVVFLKRANKL